MTVDEVDDDEMAARIAMLGAPKVMVKQIPGKRAASEDAPYTSGIFRL